MRKQHQGYCTDLIGDFTLDWLKRRDPQKPFFAMCHHKAPHRSWQPAPKYQSLFENQAIPEPDNSVPAPAAERCAPKPKKLIAES